MTTTDDADREALVHICDSLTVYPETLLVESILRAGFRRAPSAPTRDFAARLKIKVRSMRWINDGDLAAMDEVCDGIDHLDASATTPPEVGGDAEEQIAYWQRAAHEIEQELTKERDAAVADAAALRKALVDIAYPYGGDFAGVPAHYTTTRARARTALALTAAPAADVFYTGEDPFDWEQLCSDCGMSIDAETRAEFVHRVRQIVEQAAPAAKEGETKGWTKYGKATYYDGDEATP